MNIVTLTYNEINDKIFELIYVYFNNNCINVFNTIKLCIYKSNINTYYYNGHNLLTFIIYLYITINNVSDEAFCNLFDLFLELDININYKTPGIFPKKALDLICIYNKKFPNIVNLYIKLIDIEILKNYNIYDLINSIAKNINNIPNEEDRIKICKHIVLLSYNEFNSQKLISYSLTDNILNNLKKYHLEIVTNKQKQSNIMINVDIYNIRKLLMNITSETVDLVINIINKIEDFDKNNCGEDIIEQIISNYYNNGQEIISGVTLDIKNICLKLIDICLTKIKNINVKLKSRYSRDNTYLHRILTYIGAYFYINTYEDNILLINKFIQKGSDINLKNDNGDFPLTCLLRNCNTNTFDKYFPYIKYFIDNGAIINDSMLNIIDSINDTKTIFNYYNEVSNKKLNDYNKITFNKNTKLFILDNNNKVVELVSLNDTIYIGEQDNQ